MNDRETTRIKVQQIYYNNFVNIVLAVVSIVQGLAFNDLATRFPKIYPSGDYIIIAHFILCFVLLLRIFQTYVTAALDYDNWELGFVDIFIIFVVGLLEYFVFSSLVEKDFKISDFHGRLLVLSTLALAGYLRTLRKLYKNRFSGDGVEPQYYEAEVRLQCANLLGIVLSQSISIYIWLSAQQTTGTYIFLVILVSLIMGMNIFYSIRITFSRAKIEREQIKKAELQDTPASPPSDDESTLSDEGINIESREAKKHEVDQLLDLIAGNFSYVYETLFDTSPRLTRKIMRAVLLAWGGRHEWGYRKFHVAVDKKTKKVVGFIKIETAKNGIILNRTASRFILAVTLIRYIGLVGLIRTFRNLKSVESATSPVFESNELHINYIAVDIEYRRKGIAAKLINIACEKAKNEGKDCVALEVREANQTAREFFDKRGFSEDEKIASEYDYLFQKGKRVRMTKKI